MDLTTRCPHCGTTFPASLEQLQLRKGYIRCISCANIFDGYEAVVSGDATAAPPRAAEPPFQRPAPLKDAAGEPGPIHGSTAVPAGAAERRAPSEPPSGQVGRLPAAPPARQPDVPAPETAGGQAAPPWTDANADAAPSGPDTHLIPARAAPPATAPSHTISEAGGAAATSGAARPAFTISATPSHVAGGDRRADRPDFHIGDIVRRRPGQRDSVPAQEDVQADAGVGPGIDRPVRSARQEPVIGAAPLPADSGRQAHYVATPSADANEPVIHAPGRYAARHGHDEDDHREPVLPIRSRAEAAGHRPGEVYIAPRAEPRITHSLDDGYRVEPRRYRAGMIARVFWRALVVLGLALLLAQLAYVYRAQIANQVPVLRPILERACASLDCEVSYAREIDAIAIMNSALRAETASSSGDDEQTGEQNSGPTDTMILSFTLRNSYDKPQEWPTLALGLTDFSGTLVVRKNLPPEAYLPPEVAGRPFAAGSEITARVPIALNEHKVSGYQLDKFFQ